MSSDILLKLMKFGKPMITDLDEASQYYFLQTSGKGTVKETQIATDHLIEQVVDRCDITAKLDLMAREAEFNFRNSRDLTERACDKLGIGYRDLLGEIIALVQFRGLHEVHSKFPKKDVLETLTRLANRNRYHPFLEALESIEWDGRDRIPDFQETLITHPNYREDWLKDVYLVKALRQSIQCLYNCTKDYDNPKQVGHMPLIIGASGCGKTSYVKGLPPHRRYVTAAKELKLDASSITGKSDVIMQVTKTLFTEIGEYDATTAKSAVASINNFLTDEIDEGRMAFRLLPFRYPRATCFWATVEDHECIQSLRGMRRIWPIWVTSCAHQYNLDHPPLATEDKWQLFAQIKAEVDKGAPYFLSPDEERAHAKQFHEHISSHPLLDRLDVMIERGKRDGVQAKWYNMEMILKELDPDDWRRLANDPKFMGKVREVLHRHNIPKHPSRTLSSGKRIFKCYAIPMGMYTSGSWET